MNIELSFKKGYEILIKNPSLLFFAAIYFIISGTVYIFRIWFNSLMNARTPQEMAALLGLLLHRVDYLLLIFTFLILIFLFSIYLSICIIIFTYDSLKGRPSLEEALKKALKRFSQGLAASFLYALAVIAPISLIFLALLSPLCCFAVLIIPILCIYLAIRLLFYIYPISIFNIGAIEGLKESWEVTRGKALETFLLLLLIGLISLPVGIAQSAIPHRYFFLAFPLIFVSAIINIWAISVMTVSYLQLAGKYGIWGLIEEQKPVQHTVLRTSILLVGFSPEEVEALKELPLPAYSISVDALYVPLKDILKNPEIYRGDGGWNRKKIVIIHGADSNAIETIIGNINERCRGVVFTTTTETSLEWTLKYLLKEMHVEDYS